MCPEFSIDIAVFLAVTYAHKDGNPALHRLDMLLHLINAKNAGLYANIIG